MVGSENSRHHRIYVFINSVDKQVKILLSELILV